MTPAQGLHTFARRYCMERHSHWASKYEAMAREGRDRRGGDYSPDAYATFPRYNMLHAILLRVESFDYDDLPGMDQLLEHLISAGQRAETAFTRGRSNPIQLAAQDEERTLFVEAVRDAASGGNPSAEPLTYRRVLNTTEVTDLRTKLAATWGVTKTYWYPLGRKTHPSLVAFGLDEIDEAELQVRIRAFFRTRGIERIFELREYGDESYCVQAGVEDLYYTGAEGYWVSSENDWIVYCSHERTITLGGSIVEIAPKTGRVPEPRHS